MSEQEYPSLIRKHWPKYLPETLAGSPPTPSSGVLPDAQLPKPFPALGRGMKIYPVTPPSRTDRTADEFQFSAS